MRLLASSALVASALALPKSPAMSSRAAGSAKVLMANTGHIYLYDYDGSSFTNTLTYSDDGHSASWLALAGKDRLYAVDEISSTTRLFNLDIEGSSITPATSAEGSSGVVHLEFTPDQTRMVGAAYGQGSVDVWDISDGGLKLMKTLKSDDPLGPNPDRQEQAHPHETVLDPSGRFLAVNDLGTDHILLIDSKDDAFEIVNHIPVTPAGTGPRHGAFYPQGADKATHYFLACEIMNKLAVFALEYTDDGSIDFTQIQTLSSYGPDSPPATPDQAALGELVLAPNNEDIYISNRLSGNDTDSVAHFKIVPADDPADLKVEFANDVTSSGKLPRMFSISDSGAELLLGNQDGELGAVAIARNDDGSLEAKPKASLPASDFGESGSGPQFVKQIA